MTNNQTVTRGAIDVAIGEVVISISKAVGGFHSNNVVIHRNELNDAIDALYALRELIEPRTHTDNGWRDIAADLVRLGKDSVCAFA